MANKIIDSLTYGSDNYTFTIPYGTCDTDADDPHKVVVCPNFVALETGARIAVRFENYNEAGMTGDAVTLKVNNTDEKPVYYTLEQDSAPRWPAESVVEFIYTGTDWRPIMDSNLVSALINGELQPACSEYANSAATATYANRLSSSRTFSLSGRVNGSASFNGSTNCTISTTTPYLDKLIAQANCLAAGAKVANTLNSYPPMLVSATSSTAYANTQAKRFLKYANARGITIQTEYYSTYSDSASVEYYITNSSPYHITIYFYLTVEFYSRGSAAWETAKSKRFMVSLAPGGTASGSDSAVKTSYSDGELDDSELPGIEIEALGYDPT